VAWIKAEKVNEKPLILEESEIRKEFEKWYHSKKLVPHGLIWTNCSYEGFRAGVEFMKQRIKEAFKGLLRDIEGWNDWTPVALENEIRKSSVKKLIEKWFPFVFKEDGMD